MNSIKLKWKAKKSILTMLMTRCKSCLIRLKKKVKKMKAKKVLLFGLIKLIFKIKYKKYQ